jgi:hypothetical protein
MGWAPLLVGARLLEPNDARAVPRSRGMTIETIAQAGDDAAVSLTDITGSPPPSAAARG